MKKLLILLLLLVLPVQAFAVDWELPTYVYGTGLSSEEIETTSRLLGVPDVAKINPISGKDLENYVGGAATADEDMISSALVTKKSQGSGINVEIKTPENITRVSKEQYIGAAITAGVDDVDISIAAPYAVTGESALAGVYKAFELNGEDLVKGAMKLAQEELEVVADITGDSSDKEDFDDAKLSQAMVEIKEEIISIMEREGSISREEIEKVINEILERLELQGVLSGVHIEKMINFFVNFSTTQGLDFVKMKGQLEELGKDLAPKLKDILNEAQESGLLDKIINFFVELFNRFSSFFD